MNDYAGRTFVGTPATAPGPLGPDMLRDFSVIRRNPLAYLNKVWQRYGDVVQFPIPRPPSYLVNEPEAVRRVLVANARNYGKSTIQYRALSLVTGEGLLVADTAPWRRQRPLVQPAFHHDVLESVAVQTSAAVGRTLCDWSQLPDGCVVDVDESMMQLALEVVGHALFGADLSSDAHKLTKATLAALDVVVARARVPITPPSWLPTPANRRLNRAVAQLDAAVTSIIAERRARPSATPDMLDLLLAAHDDHGDHLSAVEVRDQVVTFIVAGHETAASALTWCWGLLAAHPQVQSRLQAEADEVLAGRMPTMADYGRLPYARAVIDETLRLYPPAWLITRQALESDELAGHHVPAGALIILSPWLSHRHPASWPDPDAFMPDRFISGHANRLAFIPFGAGLRQCIGRDFAYVEATLVLSAIASRYRVEFPEGESMPAGEPLVTIRPRTGMPVRVIAR